MNERMLKIEKHIVDMGLSIQNVVEKDEVFIVSSAALGLNNLVIDLENSNIVFYIEIGKIKDSVDRLDLYEVLLRKYNNALTGMLSTGQFGLKDCEDEDVLVMSEQLLLTDLDESEFVDVITGFSNNLLLNTSLLKEIIEVEGE